MGSKAPWQRAGRREQKTAGALPWSIATQSCLYSVCQVPANEELRRWQAGIEQRVETLEATGGSGEEGGPAIEPPWTVQEDSPLVATGPRCQPSDLRDFLNACHIADQIAEQTPLDVPINSTGISGTFKDRRVLTGTAKRSRKSKTQDSADSADLQQMLAAFAEEEEAEEQKVLAEFADYDEDKEMSTPATSEAALEEEEEEAALEEDAAVTPPTSPAAPASDSLSSTPDLVAPTPELAAPTPLPTASDEALSSEKVAPPT